MIHGAIRQSGYDSTRRAGPYLIGRLSAPLEIAQGAVTWAWPDSRLWGSPPGFRWGKFVIFTATPEQMPALDLVQGSLSEAGFTTMETEPYEVAEDLQDLFLYSGKPRPEMYLDPEFREALSPAHRGHETMRHAPKQQQALQSIQNVFGGIPFLDSILGQKAVAPEFAQLAANLSERIGRDRERALYVEFPDGTVQRPLATITVDEARLYVGLALLQAKSSQWLATTPTEIIADYLEGYRAVWLENSGDAAGEDLATAVAQYERTHEYIVQRFKFVTDDDGWLLRLEKV